MRLTRPTRLAVPIIVLALAGCGGAQVTVNEVPGGPVDLTVPGNAEGLAPASATATAEASPTVTPVAGAQATPTATPQADTATQDSTGTQTAPDGGAQTPGTDDSATNDQPPAAGSPADEFEDYCAQNPGAC